MKLYVAYQMAMTTMIFIDLKGHFCSLKPSRSHTHYREKYSV